ncbi:MAG: BlaI/MecI/CopY family transcriptional regulator [Acidobacteriaceae bacterium]
MAIPRKCFPSLTPLELRIMQVLWRIGPASVRDVRQALRPSTVLAYTSVQTMLNILERKGKVNRTLQGRAYQYRATVSREKISIAMLHDLINRVFGGSVEELLRTLIRSNLADIDRVSEFARRVAASRTDR